MGSYEGILSRSSKDANSAHAARHRSATYEDVELLVILGYCNLISNHEAACSTLGYFKLRSGFKLGLNADAACNVLFNEKINKIVKVLLILIYSDLYLLCILVGFIECNLEIVLVYICRNLGMNNHSSFFSKREILVVHVNKSCFNLYEPVVMVVVVNVKLALKFEIGLYTKTDTVKRILRVNRLSGLYVFTVAIKGTARKCGRRYSFTFISRKSNNSGERTQHDSYNGNR